MKNKLKATISTIIVFFISIAEFTVKQCKKLKNLIKNIYKRFKDVQKREEAEDGSEEEVKESNSAISLRSAKEFLKKAKESDALTKYIKLELAAFAAMIMYVINAGIELLKRFLPIVGIVVLVIATIVGAGYIIEFIFKFITGQFSLTK